VDSKAYNVENLLQEQGFILEPFDKISPGLKEPLAEGMQIVIARAFPVTITTDAGSFQHYTHATTVSGALQEFGILFAEGYYVEPELNAPVYPGKEIFFFRQVFATDTIREQIPYTIEKRMDNTVYKGRRNIIQEGKEGLKELNFRVVYAGGKELLREFIGEEVVAEPVPLIVAVGTKPLPNPPVMIASRGESVEGMASWYGSEFHGRRTTSGEIFDQNAYTAAHSSLPFGTCVNVTFLKTGKSIVVRINDRGPNTAGRIIDLSRGAAEAIGLRPHGIGKVRIEVVEVRR